jgi:hypothetical protein
MREPAPPNVQVRKDSTARRVRGVPWRRFSTWAFTAWALSTAATRYARAEDLAMPAEIEAKLSGKVAAYERTFAERAGSKVVVAIVAQGGDADSMHAATSMQAAFHALDDIGGLPHEELIVPWSNGPSLTATCLERKVSMIFVAPGLGSDIEAIVRTLEAMAILSVAGSVSYVERGLVVGFDLVSGRPKVVINLGMAKKQNLRFRSDLLSLARIIE